MHVFLARHAVTQVRPGADANVLAFFKFRALDVGRVGKPERAAVHKLKFIRAVVNQGCLLPGGSLLTHAGVACVKDEVFHHAFPQRSHLLQADRIGHVFVQKIVEHVGADVSAHLGAAFHLHVEGHDLDLIIIGGLLGNGVGIGRLVGKGLLLICKEGHFVKVQHLTVCGSHIFHVKAEQGEIFVVFGKVDPKVLPILGALQAIIHLTGHTRARGRLGAVAVEGENAAGQAIGAYLKHQVGIFARVHGCISQVLDKLRVLEIYVRVAGIGIGDRGRGQRKQLSLCVILLQGCLALVRLEYIIRELDIRGEHGEGKRGQKLGFGGGFGFGFRFGFGFCFCFRFRFRFRCRLGFSHGGVLGIRFGRLLFGRLGC